MKDLVYAGLHYGHLKKYTHPAMQQYIYGEKDGACIIDLDKTYACLHEAAGFLSKLAARGGRILFVSTKKRQSSQIVKQAAISCGQYYIDYRWLGGMLTNWKTVSSSVRVLKSLEETLEDPATQQKYTKKERLLMQRQYDKLNLTLGGIRNMSSVPDALFVVDIKLEHIAVQEAINLDIPIVAMVDTNSNPRLVEYPIPSNDDGRKSIALCCHAISQAVLKGMMGDEEEWAATKEQ